VTTCARAESAGGHTAASYVCSTARSSTPAHQPAFPNQWHTLRYCLVGRHSMGQPKQSRTASRSLVQRFGQGRACGHGRRRRQLEAPTHTGGY